MTRKMISSLFLVICLLFGQASLGSCGSDSDGPIPPSDEVSVTVPSTIDVVKGSSCALKDFIGSVSSSDKVLLENASGVLFTCEIVSGEVGQLTFAIPKDLESGQYRIYLRKDSRRIYLGNAAINVVKKQIELLPSTTIYGTVESDGLPVSGVVVSDGITTTKTDEDGIYQLASDKELGYVFISVPSGYEPETSGVFPNIYSILVAGSKTPESANFNIRKVDQSKYKVLFLGDMHLAARNNDLNQFAAVVSDINQFRVDNPDDKIYAVTLGDMTWDIYWGQFTLSQYVSTINNGIQGMHIYQTIGNHDNDYATTSNPGAKRQFVTTIAPDYYSFNIGDVHYVVLDDIDCSTYDGTTSRNYKEQIFGAQFDWLRRDLSYVDKSTPVVITSHAPVFSPSGIDTYAYNLENTDELLRILDGYTVHFITGHTHRNYNVTPAHAITEGKNIYEHNVAAVCSDWWWSGKLTPGCLLSTDGTPSGYSVWNVEGKNMENYYKTVGTDMNHQFRSYDLNHVKFTADDVPNLTDNTVLNSWMRYCKEYPGVESNEVLLNVWNYNPAWTISVTTADGKELEVTHTTAYDPLHIAAMSMKRYNTDTSSVPNFVTQKQINFFKVTAPDADTDLIITVKDEFGHTWTENMQRPKPFSTDAYRLN